MMPVRLSRFVEIILRPEVLFTLVTLQALSPYLFWQIGWGRAVSSSQLNYVPALIWVIGWACFLLGSFFVRRRIAPETSVVLFPRKRRIRIILWLLICLCSIEVELVTKVYGTLPILSYLRGDNQIDVGEATDLQEQSAVGQIALLHITVGLIGAALLETAILAIEEKKKVPAVFYLGLIVALFAGLINGKRIDMFRLFAFLFTGMFLYSKSPLKNASVVIPFFRRPWLVLLLLGLTFGGMGLLFAPLAELRNQGRDQGSSFDNLILYQEGPILNMEEQTKVAGIGPNSFNLFLPLQQMVPIKLLGSLAAFQGTRPPRVDVTAPAGFFELIQWAWGPIGIALAPFGLGMLCKWFYVNSRDRIQYLLCYSQICFAIILSHSFNEFLTAPIVLVPCVLMWFIGRWTGLKLVRGRRHDSVMDAEMFPEYPAKVLS